MSLTADDGTEIITHRLEDLAATFLDLIDTPSSYPAGSAFFKLRVNVTEDGIEFVLDDSIATFAWLSSSVDQVPITTDPTPVTFNTQNAINGITHSVSVDSDEITIDKAGIYSISPSPEIGKDSGGARIGAGIFLQVDRGSGFVDEPNTGSAVTIKDSDIMLSIMSLYMLFLDVGDVFRIMQQVDVATVGMGLKSAPAVVIAPTRPAVPSISMVVQRIGDAA